MSGDVERAKEGGYDLLAPIDAAYERGDIDQPEWHARVMAIIEPAYLAADTEQRGSGHSGTPAEWDASRGLVMTAVDAAGTFLDIGCANGLLMGSVARWSRERGPDVEPYGVEISAALADLARTRYPQWRDRIWTANADGWRPGRRFDYVRTGLEYVPRSRRRDYVRHLFEHVVAAHGRLIVGKNNEDRGRSDIADSLRSWGYCNVNEVRRQHAHPEVELSVVWLER